MKSRLLCALAVSAMCSFVHAANPDPDGVEHITALVEKGRGSPVKLEKKESITTRAAFRPPVEITIVAKTEATDLRIGYAADQVIFNWENSRAELRVDGGPANGHHKPGAGSIPNNRYVTIKWRVMPDKQMISVDGVPRYEHVGNYSNINNAVTVSCLNSKVMVRTIKVKQL